MKQKAEIVPASEQDLAVLAELAEQCFPDPQAIGRWAFGNGIITIQRKVLC